MGAFEIKIGVAGLTSGEFIQTEALVDTGATHTLLPSSLLKRLDIQPIDNIPFQLADQHVVNYEVGQVRLRLDGKERIILVVFGEPDASPLIGATTLELFNLEVDPVGKRLFPVVGLMKWCGHSEKILNSRF
jgi:clan AA aspartic protease